MGATANDTTSGVLGLEQLWARSVGDPAICLAILDGPVDQSHRSFDGADLQVVQTLVAERAGAGPAAGHGTFVASIIFGQWGGPVVGIAPRCRGLLLPIFHDAADGLIAPCSQLDLARAILQAADHGAHVINISGGELADANAAHPLLADAVQQCLDRGVLIVAAANNDSCGRRQIPGGMPGVLAVGATGDATSPCVNRRNDYRMHGILAPGEEILGASPGGGTTTASGSSFSTAIVSGVAAVFLTIQLKTGQKLDAQAVRHAMLQSAWDSPLSDQEGQPMVGQLNIQGALELITDGVHNMSESTPAENGHRHAAENGGLEFRTLPMPDLSGRAEVTGNGAGASPIATQSPVAAGSRLDLEKRETAEPRTKSAGCGCACGAQAQFVYALGQLGYDFGSEARRDSIMQHMGPAANPHDPRQMLAYLQDNPWDATSIIWTLNLDSTPIYGVKPSGPFAREICERLRDFLGQQLDEGVERVSVPGQIAGKATLMNGQVLLLIVPELRGMYSWTTKALVEAVCGNSPGRAGRNANRAKNGAKVSDAKMQGVASFLDRVYFASRNLGVTSQDRAINYAATNALNIERVYEAAMKEEMDLDTIEVERSPVCRPDSDCWDVKLMFFFPQRQVQTVRKAYRFTVDVSDVVPVMVGKMRDWYMR